MRLHNVLHDFLEPLESSNLQDSLFGKKEVKLDEEKLLAIYEERWQADGYGSKEEREKYYQKGKNILKTLSE